MVEDRSDGHALARCSDFGPFDVLSDRAHEHYLDGYSDQAVVAARQALPLVRAAGDLQTVRYLHYTSGVALIELRRWQEAVDEAHLLLRVIEPADLAWRAKALSLLGDASLRLGRASQAVDALAEAYSLVEAEPPQRYNDLSAAMAVATVLGHAQLFEPADALFELCLTSPAVDGSHPATVVARVMVMQEVAVLHATWAAALELDGRHDEAVRRSVRSAEVALRIMSATVDLDPEMNARGRVVEAFAQQRLGQPALATARLREATAMFSQREELPEVQIAGVGLAQSLIAAGDYDGARAGLHRVLEGTRTTDRVVWELWTLSMLAQVELAEHGPHPAAEYLLQGRRTASHRLWVERESRFFALRDRMSLRALAAEASQLGRDALIDPLTGLGNRRMLDAGIAETVGGAALFVDVDRFKAVNDTFSHAVGDEVLRRVADILRAHCRTQDVVVRFGGDEFVVLLPVTATAEAAVVAERVRAAVHREPWDEVAPGLGVSVSVGVAGSGVTAERVVEDADAALYEAKLGGRNRVSVR